MLKRKLKYGAKENLWRARSQFAISFSSMKVSGANKKGIERVSLLNAADSNQRSSEVQVQCGQVDFEAEPIGGKNDSSANNGSSVIKEVREIGLTSLDFIHVNISERKVKIEDILCVSMHSTDSFSALQ